MNLQNNHYRITKPTEPDPPDPFPPPSRNETIADSVHNNEAKGPHKTTLRKSNLLLSIRNQQPNLGYSSLVSQTASSFTLGPRFPYEKSGLLAENKLIHT